MSNIMFDYAILDSKTVAKTDKNVVHSTTVPMASKDVQTLIVRDYSLNSIKKLKVKKKHLDRESQCHFQDGGKQVYISVSTTTYEFLQWELIGFLEYVGVTILNRPGSVDLMGSKVQNQIDCSYNGYNVTINLYHTTNSLLVQDYKKGRRSNNVIHTLTPPASHFSNFIFNRIIAPFENCEFYKGLKSAISLKLQQRLNKANCHTYGAEPRNAPAIMCLNQGQANQDGTPTPQGPPVEEQASQGSKDETTVPACDLPEQGQIKQFEGDDMATPKTTVPRRHNKTLQEEQSKNCIDISQMEIPEQIAAPLAISTPYEISLLVAQGQMIENTQNNVPTPHDPPDQAQTNRGSVSDPTAPGDLPVHTQQSTQDGTPTQRGAPVEEQASQGSKDETTVPACDLPEQGQIKQFEGDDMATPKTTVPRRHNKTLQEEQSKNCIDISQMEIPEQIAAPLAISTPYEISLLVDDDSSICSPPPNCSRQAGVDLTPIEFNPNTCKKCNIEVTEDGVFCAICSRWFHFSCEKTSQSQVMKDYQEPLYYICLRDRHFARPDARALPDRVADQLKKLREAASHNSISNYVKLSKLKSNLTKSQAENKTSLAKVKEMKVFQKSLQAELAASKRALEDQTKRLKTSLAASESKVNNQLLEIKSLQNQISLRRSELSNAEKQMEVIGSQQLEAVKKLEEQQSYINSLEKEKNKLQTGQASGQATIHQLSKIIKDLKEQATQSNCSQRTSNHTNDHSLYAKQPVDRPPPPSHQLDTETLQEDDAILLDVNAGITPIQEEIPASGSLLATSQSECDLPIGTDIETNSNPDPPPQATTLNSTQTGNNDPTSTGSEDQIQQLPQNNCSKSIKVSSKLIGIIIGKGGRTIQSLKGTEADIRITEGTSSSILTITGTPTSTQNALDQIKEKFTCRTPRCDRYDCKFIHPTIHSASASQTTISSTSQVSDIQKRLQRLAEYPLLTDTHQRYRKVQAKSTKVSSSCKAHNSIMGKLMGKEGINIKELRKKHSTKILVRAECDEEGNREITIHGEPANVEACQTEISAIFECSFGSTCSKPGCHFTHPKSMELAKNHWPQRWVPLPQFPMQDSHQPGPPDTQQMLQPSSLRISADDQGGRYVTQTDASQQSHQSSTTQGPVPKSQQANPEPKNMATSSDVWANPQQLVAMITKIVRAELTQLQNTTEKA